MTNQNTHRSRPPIRSTYHDDADMAELVDLFVRALPERVAAIREAFERSAVDELRSLSHQLKGAAGGYGFPDVSTAAAAIEGPLRTGEVDLNSLVSNVDDLSELCERVIAGRTVA